MNTRPPLENSSKGKGCCSNSSAYPRRVDTKGWSAQHFLANHDLGRHVRAFLHDGRDGRGLSPSGQAVPPNEETTGCLHLKRYPKSTFQLQRTRATPGRHPCENRGRYFAFPSNLVMLKMYGLLVADLASGSPGIRGFACEFILLLSAIRNCLARTVVARTPYIT